MPGRAGSQPTTAEARIASPGADPAGATTTAAAPSPTRVEVAAVTVPPSTSGARRARAAAETPMPSSPIIPATGTISASKRPAARAVIARAWLRWA